MNLVSSHCLLLESEEQEQLNEQLEKFWKLDTLGIDLNENDVHAKFLEDLKFDGVRYEAKLPWKNTHELLPDNYQLSVKHLNSLISRLKREPEVFKAYNDIINDQLQNGIIEDIPENSQCEVGKVHYLPHHPVIRNDKSTSWLHVVFNASSSVNGVSLNSVLNAGPSLLPLLMSVLVRFRFHSVGLVSDIKQAFLQISVNEEDRNCLRFLWINSIDEEHPEIVIRRFQRILFGVNASPFILGGTIHLHVSGYRDLDPDFIKCLLESIYVDDLTTGADNADEGFVLYKKAKEIMSSASFHLRKWKTNSRELRKLIEESEGESQEATTEAENKVIEEDEPYVNLLIGSSNKPQDHVKRKF